MSTIITMAARSKEPAQSLGDHWRGIMPFIGIGWAAAIAPIGGEQAFASGTISGMPASPHRVAVLTPRPKTAEAATVPTQTKADFSVR